MLVNIDEPKAAYATLANMLFKAVDVRPFVVVVDYHPVKVRISHLVWRGVSCAALNDTECGCGVQADYAALRDGSLQELVNLVDWANVVVRFKAASLQNVHSARALATLLCDQWLADMRSNQAVQMLEGAKPVAAFVRLGAAVHEVASRAVALPNIAKVCPRTDGALLRLLLRSSMRHTCRSCRAQGRAGRDRTPWRRGVCCIAPRVTCCTRLRWRPWAWGLGSLVAPPMRSVQAARVLRRTMTRRKQQLRRGPGG